jgi:phage terminase large subunit GpA-like protein
MSTEYIWEEQKVKQRMILDTTKYLKKIPLSITDKTIMEHASEKRVINNGPRQGPYDPNYTRYLIEPVDWLSINSIGQRSILLKSAQIGATTAAENLICYYMNEHPASQLYISGTEKLLKSWATEKLEPAIDSFGIRKYISAQTENKKTKTTGDIAFMKMYHGCTLDLVTARSGPSLRNKPKQILVRDEIDSAPRVLSTGEGNWLEVSYVRTNSYGDRRKVFDLSTPTTEFSLIYEEFLTGDQRKYYVPCPVCGVCQELEFGNDYTEYGLKGSINEYGIVTDAYYMCKHCKQRIEEHKKRWMLDSGYYEPTAQTTNPFLRSYHIHTLYAPPGMVGWKEIFEKWEKAKQSKEKMISFTNLYMGMPYIDDSEVIEINTIDSGSEYKSKEVPDGVLWITIGADVQIGSTVDKSNPPRIELEVLGHGRNYRTWSIEYKVFLGNTKDAYSGAFEDLYKWMKETNLIYTTKNDVKLGASIGGIDSGEGRVLMPVVYEFCKRTNGFLFPTKGFGKLVKKPGEKFYKDMPNSRDNIKYRLKVIDQDLALFEISTVYYKDNFYSNLRKTRQDGDIQKPGFCDFPNDYGKRYYTMLTAEQRNKEDGSYSAKGKRNEALDCRIINMAISDFFIDHNVKLMRENAVKKGADKKKMEEKIKSTSFISLLEGKMNQKIKAKYKKQ